MVQASQDGRRPDATIAANLMVTCGGRGKRVKLQRNPRPKTLVRTSVVVVRYPLNQGAPQVARGAPGAKFRSKPDSAALREIMDLPATA
jgi:hypothetical protein